MTVSPSTIVRADLVGLIERELLGPRNGPEEEIRGTPRAAYMVGALAPVTVDPERAGRSADSGSESTIAIDDGADPNETGRGVNDIDPVTAGQRGVPAATDEEAGTAVDDEDRDD